MVDIPSHQVIEPSHYTVDGSEIRRESQLNVGVVYPTIYKVLTNIQTVVGNGTSGIINFGILWDSFWTFWTFWPGPPGQENSKFAQVNEKN